MGQPHKIEKAWIPIAVVMVCGLLSSSDGHAATTNTRQSQERTARKACLSGDYEKGVSILSDLFVDTKDPTYIFNQARCFEQNRRYEDAIARFQEYLRAAPDLPADDKALTEKHIADCQDILAKQAPRTTAVAPVVAAPVVVPPPSEPPAVTPVAPTGVVQQVGPAPTGDRPGSGLRAAGIATASVGAAAVIAGVVLNLKVNSMASDLEALGGYSDNKESQRKTYQTLGWIGYGAGAACIATGAVLYYLGLRSASQTDSGLTFAPILGPGQTGAAVGGRF